MTTGRRNLSRGLARTDSERALSPLDRKVEPKGAFKRCQAITGVSQLPG